MLVLRPFFTDSLAWRHSFALSPFRSLTNQPLCSPSLYKSLKTDVGIPQPDSTIPSIHSEIVVKTPTEFFARKLMNRRLGITKLTRLIKMILTPERAQSH